MTKYSLPDLTYDYGALEPHISAKIMQLHHDKHHKTYVDGANQTLEALEEAREKGDFARIAALEQQLGFHISGHVLHSIFWRNLSPDGGGKPVGELATAIDRDFGSFDKFKQQLTKAAGTCMGSGWGALILDTLSGRLLIWDALASRFRTVRLRADPHCALCGPEATIKDLSAHRARVAGAGAERAGTAAACGV